MHPIERLRYVARASDAPADDVVREAASSLAGFSEDPASLVTACRRLVDRHPANGPIWWLCARVLAAAGDSGAAWRCLDELGADPTMDELSNALPAESRVVVIGWPERLTTAFARVIDVEVRVIDVDGDGPGFVRMLERLDVAAVDVDVTGLAPAVASSTLVVVEPSAIGPDVALAGSGNWAAAAVARASQVPVWAVAGRGRLVPPVVWPSLSRRLGGAATAPWDRDQDQVPLDLVDCIVGPVGPEPVADGLARLDTPDVPELRR